MSTQLNVGAINVGAIIGIIIGDSLAEKYGFKRF
jgi:hypothetical protein